MSEHGSGGPQSVPLPMYVPPATPQLYSFCTLHVVPTQQAPVMSEHGSGGPQSVPSPMYVPPASMQ